METPSSITFVLEGVFGFERKPLRRVISSAESNYNDGIK